MDNLQASRINGGNTAYKRNESDFYPTPPEVTKALMDRLGLPKWIWIWEPACGENHIVNELKREGYNNVIATDIKNGIDFLTCNTESLKYCWIITNPPFSIADKFINRCIELNRPFALLLKSQYWHSKKRFELFKNNPPSAIYPLTWRPDFLFKKRGKGSPLMDIMWCVWNGETKFGETIYMPLQKPIIAEDNEKEKSEE